jgi:hypothetical protein
MGRGHDLYIVEMDVPAELEVGFSRIYDTEHGPQFLKVPGIRNCWRCRPEHSTKTDTPRYTAIFSAREFGEWKAKIAPYVTNRLSQLVRLIERSGAARIPARQRHTVNAQGAEA